MNFLSLIITAFSSVFYGVIATAVVMAILYIILKGVSKSIVQTPVFFISGVILAILLIIQLSLMIGAIQAKNAADATEIYLSQLLENQRGIVGAQDSQQIMDAITDKFPIIGTYIDIADFSGHDVSELPKAMHASMIDFLNSYIWHRILWSLAVIITACTIAMLFDRKALVTGKTKRKTTMAARKNYDDF